MKRSVRTICRILRLRWHWLVSLRWWSLGVFGSSGPAWSIITHRIDSNRGENDHAESTLEPACCLCHWNLLCQGVRLETVFESDFVVGIASYRNRRASEGPYPHPECLGKGLILRNPWRTIPKRHATARLSSTYFGGIGRRNENLRARACRTLFS